MCVFKTVEDGYYNISPTSNDVYSTNASFFGYNCIGNLSGFNQNISDAPKFIDAGTGFGTNSTMGNYRLGGDAPCINAGTNQGWMTTTCPYDLDGRPRVRYDTVDMGAYEFIHSGTVFGFR